MRPSWTLRDGKWVRPETNEVDSRPFPGITDGHPPGMNTGRRPKPGEKCHKPSDSLLRDLYRVQDETRQEALAKRRERVFELDRGLDSGQVRVDPSLRLGIPAVAVPMPNGVTQFVPEDRVPEVERERLERDAEARRVLSQPAPFGGGGEEFRAGDGERVVVSEDITGAIPAVRDRSLDVAEFTSWTPRRNPDHRML
jgi:hypothetical protein